MYTVEIVPTVVPDSFADVSAAFERVRSFSPALHIDAADGTLAPNMTWVPASGERLPEAAVFTYEAHLMMSRPDAAVRAFLAAGVTRIVVHAEAFHNGEAAHGMFTAWRTQGARSITLALLIDTPLDVIESFRSHIDGIMLMTIGSIGRQGIPFDDHSFGRVAELASRYSDIAIAVDGGVNETNIAALARVGASRFSVGSALATAQDPAAAYRRLKTLAENTLQ